MYWRSRLFESCSDLLLSIVLTQYVKYTSPDQLVGRPHHYHLNPKRSAETAPNIPNEPDLLHRDIDFYALTKPAGLV